MQSHPKKSLGQHWLNDGPSLDAMVESAAVDADDEVFEIGPGTGFLTDKLLTKKAHVLALEFDEQLAKKLQQRYAGKASVSINHGDVRDFDLSSLPSDYKIVANIPYYLTANLLRKLVDAANKPVIAALLIQKEVAQRIASQPGNLSLIAVLVQLFYEPTLGKIVSAGLFEPPPKVDSQILILHKRSRPLYEPSAELFKVIKAGFSQKRKKMRTSLAGGLGISKSASSELLAQAQIDEHKRPQELTHGEWYRLSSIYASAIMKR